MSAREDGCTSSGRPGGWRSAWSLSALPYLHVTSAAEQHVGDTMVALAARGQHRTPVPDLMLAAIAQAGSAVVLHYDADYERIAAVTGQPHQWIIPRGSGHDRRSDH